MENAFALNWTLDWKLVIAVVALAQPWLIALYKRLFQKAQVEVFEAGTIEIGYSSFGPTIGLNGTMTVKGHDAFVSAIHLKLVREKDGATHVFEWGLFRSSRVKYSKPADVELELASGYMLMPKQAHRYNILFNEPPFVTEMNARLTETVNAWNVQTESIPARQHAEPNASFVQIQTEVYQEFLGTKEALEGWNAVDRMKYWDAGSYRLTMSIDTVHPDVTFDYAWRFTLSANDATRLGYNTPRIVDNACGMGEDQWMFAFCAYEGVK